MEIISSFIHPYIFVGDEGVYVEGVKRIFRWESDVIVLQSGKRLEISGDGLRIEYKSADTILVSGRVEKIEFFSGKRKC